MLKIHTNVCYIVNFSCWYCQKGQEQSPGCVSFENSRYCMALQKGTGGRCGSFSNYDYCLIVQCTVHVIWYVLRECIIQQDFELGRIPGTSSEEMFSIKNYDFFESELVLSFISKLQANDKTVHTLDAPNNKGQHNPTKYLHKMSQTNKLTIKVSPKSTFW